MKVRIDKITKRFTGDWTGDIGSMEPTETTLVIETPNLPPVENLNKQKFHKWDTHSVQTGTTQVPVMVQEKDELGELLWEDEGKTIPKMIQEVDELGNPKFTEEPIYENITEWIFEEEDAYNTWVEEQSSIIPEPTDQEKIKTLNNQISEIGMTIEALMLDILPNLGGV